MESDNIKVINGQHILGRYVYIVLYLASARRVLISERILEVEPNEPFIVIDFLSAELYVQNGH